MCTVWVGDSTTCLSLNSAHVISGTARIYDDKFNLIADLALGSTDGTSFVNDVIITKEAAYFTDMLQSQYYKVCQGWGVESVKRHR